MAPPIMLVHGTAGWSGFWHDVAAHLAARGWRVIASTCRPSAIPSTIHEGRYDRVDARRSGWRRCGGAGGPAGDCRRPQLRRRPGDRAGAAPPGSAAVAGAGRCGAGRARSAAPSGRRRRHALASGWLAQLTTAASGHQSAATRSRCCSSMLARKEQAEPGCRSCAEPMRAGGHDRGLCRLAAEPVRDAATAR